MGREQVLPPQPAGGEICSFLLADGFSELRPGRRAPRPELRGSLVQRAWWLDGVVALGIAGWAVVKGRQAWAGKSYGCACQPGATCWPLFCRWRQAATERARWEGGCRCAMLQRRRWLVRQWATVHGRGQYDAQGHLLLVPLRAAEW